MRVIVLLLLLISIGYSQCEIPILFEHPRDGNFKFHRDQGFDSSTLIHGMGSFMLTCTVAAIFKVNDVSENNALWAGAAVWGLGFLKECEDGYREGFSGQDLLSNTIGCVVGASLFATLDYYHSKRVKAGITYDRLYLTVNL